LAVFDFLDFEAFFFVLFDFAVVVVEVVPEDVTRDECLVLCRTVLLPAASAGRPMASAAISERAMSVNRLRIIQDPPPTRYLDGSKKP
jgi:hypothetical protein